MGIEPSLRARAYEMKHMRLVDAAGHPEALASLAPMRETVGGRFISIERAQLAEALFGACEGIPAHFGVSIRALVQDDDGVIVTRSDGRSERFDLVIGADGLHSRVRAQAFGPETRFEKFLDCYVAAARLRGYPHRDELTYVSHTVPGRQVARVSLRNDETLVLLVGKAELFDSDPPRERLIETLRHAFGDTGWEVPEILASLEGAEDVYFDRVSQTYLPQWSRGRVALVGDAVACPSLLAGEGTGLAMLEAYVLAGELGLTDRDYARAFANYERRLRAFVTAKQKAALRLRGFFTPRSRLGLSVRNVVVRALDHRFLVKPLLTRSMRDDLDLPAYGAVQPMVSSR
jgi:2-polyprenyl-6-methoxyphenol hydroxylase-like FAD-dependent oxidoreductase